jgi:hypothetical protein
LGSSVQVPVNSDLTAGAGSAAAPGVAMEGTENCAAKSVFQIIKLDVIRAKYFKLLSQIKDSQ